jgi:membrane protein YqaA with SNARE-associated domain
MPVDFIVATYVHQDRGRMLVYVAMASLGSALGSIPLYIIGYLGGEKVLRKRIPEERFLKIHQSFERNEFWALMLPGMLPPPTPFFVRFLVLSLLVLWFGPQIINHFGGILKEHWLLLSGVILELALVLWLFARTRRLKKNTAPPSGSGVDTPESAN